MATSPEQLVRHQRLTDAVAAREDRLVRALIGYIVRVLRNLFSTPGAAYDDKQVNETAKLIATQIRSGQRQIADLMTASIAESLVIDKVGPAPKPRVSLPPDMRGVPEEFVWERPVKEYRRARLLGVEEAQAQEKAFRRARSIAEADMGIARTESARQGMSSVPLIQGYRRVLHPELSRTGVCGLCIAAATRIYKSDELMPIHDRCRCEVKQITRFGDPGADLNDFSLKELYKLAGGTDAFLLKEVRYKVMEHGELGPTLVPKAHDFATKKDRTKDTGRRKFADDIEREIARLERQRDAAASEAGRKIFQRKIDAIKKAKAG